MGSRITHLSFRPKLTNGFIFKQRPEARCVMEIPARRAEPGVGSRAPGIE
jgi:hypothetical protein